MNVDMNLKGYDHETIDELPATKFAHVCPIDTWLFWGPHDATSGGLFSTSAARNFL